MTNDWEAKLAASRRPVVLVESLHGHSGRYANTNRFLKTCIIETLVTERTARRAAELRRRARHESAVDAIVVALAEPGGTILTGGAADEAEIATVPEQVWLTAESLGRRDAALVAWPGAPAVFVFDQLLLGRLLPQREAPRVRR